MLRLGLFPSGDVAVSARAVTVPMTRLATLMAISISLESSRMCTHALTVRGEPFGHLVAKLGAHPLALERVHHEDAAPVRLRHSLSVVDDDDLRERAGRRPERAVHEDAAAELAGVQLTGPVDVEATAVFLLTRFHPRTEG